MANQKKLRIVPLGGLEQIGMNITAFCYGESIIVVDCGLAFPEDDMLGIDLVIPDISFLREHADQVKAFFITHGHEDHIGALPYILRELPVPLYGTKLTLAIIRNKLEEYKMAEEQDFRVVSYGDVVSEGDFSVEFIRTNHSIADAAALAITCKAGTVIHTGDFKVDFTPVFGSPIDLTRFGELGKKGVLALMCDSTNALKPGNTMSERTVGKTFDTVFAEMRTTESLLPPSLRMSTAFSRSSIPQSVTDEKSSSKAAAWSISFRLRRSSVISGFPKGFWYRLKRLRIIRTTRLS